MQLGMIGLGRMGANIVRRLMRDGHDVRRLRHECRTRWPSSSREGADGSSSLEEFVAKLEHAAGRLGDDPRRDHRQGGRPARRADGSTATSSSTAATPTTATTYAGPPKLREHGIHYVDVGTSGGVFGLERGYCLMVGGTDDGGRPTSSRAQDDRSRPGEIDRTPGRSGEPAPEEQGYLHCGPSGAGHFVKMVHNGIEYGIMAAYAEGLNMLDNADAGIQAEQSTRPRSPRSSSRSTTSSTSTSPRSPSCGGAAR